MKLRLTHFLCTLSLLSLLPTFPVKAAAQRRYKPPSRSTPIAGQPYERFSTRDRFGREITFYLSEAPAGRGPLPLVLYIEGSGCGSRFEERDGKIFPAGGHIVVADVFKGRARVIVVEKPGVKFLFQPEDGCKGSAEFNREHTLERWAEANEAALRAARRLPQVDKNRALVVGHSEGGLVACRVARELPEIVTHVSTMAGGGPSQLYDLIALARQGRFFEEVSPDAEARVQYVLDKWREIEAEPTSSEKFFFGFAYRRWATFLASSPIAELSAARAKIYVAQGTADVAVDPTSADALFAHLISGNKPVTYDRVEGANHSFRIKDKPKTDGWRELIERVSEWFLRP
ncbi:MAG: alpha/beta fold hydrolase [Pyrinomonadaceae bacterium]